MYNIVFDIILFNCEFAFLGVGLRNLFVMLSVILKCAVRSPILTWSDFHSSVCSIPIQSKTSAHALDAHQSLRVLMNIRLSLQLKISLSVISG